MKIQLEIKVAEDDLLTGLQEALAVMKAVNLPVQSVKVSTGYNAHRWIALKASSNVTDVIKIYNLEKEIERLQDIRDKHKAESLLPEFYCGDEVDGSARCEKQCACCNGVKLKS